MGGHGGLNILPQKKWNVYNYDNRDIVDKDKKQHAQKMRKKYQSDRKSTLSQKFDVLKGQNSENEQEREHFKQSVKNDSVLNGQLRRLAQQNKHVNLFENEQKIIENRELIECHKLKEAEWLKDKNMDYSSKFLGTYNDNSKLPWYAKNKNLDKPLKNQRYQMQDLVDQVRIQKIKKRNYCKDQVQKIQKSYQGVSRHQINQPAKREHNQQRQRSRDRKYIFLKNRQQILFRANLLHNQKQQNADKFRINSVNKKVEDKINQNTRQHVKSTDNNEKQLISTKKQKTSEQQSELQHLRIKRMKRQEKQRKKAQQLKQKLIQSISRN